MLQIKIRKMISTLLIVAMIFQLGGFTTFATNLSIMTNNMVDEESDKENYHSDNIQQSSDNLFGGSIDNIENDTTDDENIEEPEDDNNENSLDEINNTNETNEIVETTMTDDASETTVIGETTETNEITEISETTETNETTETTTTVKSSDEETQNIVLDTSTISEASNLNVVEEEIVATDSETTFDYANEINDISTTSEVELFVNEENSLYGTATESNVLNLEIATNSETNLILLGVVPTPIPDSDKYTFDSGWWGDASAYWSNQQKSQVRKINITPMNFGNYWQGEDVSATAVKDPISWKILDKSNEDKTLLMSDKILYAMGFGLNANDKYPGWAGSYIRESLNNTTDGFVMNAFNELERKLILTTHVKTSGQKNQYGNIFSGGPDTYDKVFIPSVEDVKRYFGSNAARIAKNTAYVNANYWRHDLPGADEPFRYWLRNPAYYVDNQQAKTVEYDGRIDETFGDTCTYANGVRPMLWVNFNYKVFEPISISNVRFEETERVNDREVVHYYMMNDGTLEIKLALGYQKIDVTNTAELFAGFTNCTEINGLQFLDFENVTDMSKMFYGDTNLQKIELSENFGLNATNMESMFEGTKITNIPNNLNTSSATNMKRMFADCRSLTEFNIASISFATAAVDATELLNGCNHLEKILVDTNVRSLPANVTATDMFLGCTSLKGGGGFRYNEDIVDGTFARVDYGGIIPGYFTCTDESIYDTVNIDVFSDWADDLPDGVDKSFIEKIVFTNDEVMEDVDASFSFPMTPTRYAYLKDSNKTIVVHYAHQIDKLKTGNTWDDFFSDFTHVEVIEGLGNIDTSTVTTMQRTFQNCISLRTIDLGDISFDSCTNTSYMFQGCINLTTIYVDDISYGLPESVTEKNDMFWECNSLVGGEGTNYSFVMASGVYARVDYGGILPGYFTLKGTEEEIREKYANAVFTLPNDWYHGYKPKEQITKIKFYNDATIGSFEEIFTMSPPGAATESVAYLDGTTVKIHFGRHIPKLKVNSDWSGFFKDFTYLNTIEGFDFIDTTNVTKINELFSGCSALTNITFETDLPNVTEMEKVFYNCYALQSVTFNDKLNLGKVTTLESAFENCTHLTTLNAGIASLSSIQSLKKAFKGCSSLTQFSFDVCDTPTLNDTSEMFYDCSNLARIYVSDNFQGLNVANSTDMFFNCVNLVGGQGFTFDSAMTSGEFARVDYGGIMPGYYTLNGTAEEIRQKYANAEFNLPTDWFNIDPVLGINKNNISKIKFYNANVMEHYDAPFYISNTDKTIGYCSNNGDGTWTVQIHFGYSIPKLKVGANWAGFFKDFTNLTTIEGLNLLNVEDVENMSELFSGCSSLTSLSFNPNTQNVTNMSKMFYNCSNLTTLALGSSFKLDKVVDLSSAFEGCAQLSSMNIGTANFKSIQNLNKTFKGCAALTTFTFEISETASLTNSAEMFSGCTNLRTIYVTDNFQGLNGVTRDNMFLDCTNLVGGQGFAYNTANPDAANGVYGRVDYGGIMPGYFTLTNTSKYNETVFNLPKNWFNPPAVSGITKDSISKIKFYNDAAGIGDYSVIFNISLPDRTVGYLEQDPDDASKYIAKIHFGHSIPSLKVGEDFSEFFKDFTSLTSIEGLSLLNLSNVKYMNDTFSGCTNLTTLNFNPAMPNVVSMDRIFKDCTSLQSVTMGSNLGLGNVESMESAFENCSSLTIFNLGNASLSKVGTISNAFKDCTSLTSFALNLGNSTALMKTDGMFSGCTNLTTIDATKFNMTNVSTVKEMFSRCENLTNILVGPNFDTQMVTDYEKMFYNCSRLETINGIKFNNNRKVIKTMKSMFEACNALSEIDLSAVNTLSMQIDGFHSMFKDCDNLTKLTFGEGFRLGTNPLGYNLTSMFNGCESLTIIDLSTFEKETESGTATPVINVTDMFKDCRSLTTIIVKTNFVSPTAAGGETFRECANLVGGAGTVYDASHMGSSYAHIDEGTANPGYFSGDVVIITYLGGDGATGQMDIQIASKSGTTTLRANSFTKAGYTFVNWADQKGNKYTTTITNPAKSLVLTAQWKKNPKPYNPEDRRGGGGSSGSGGGGGGGPRIANNLTQTINFIDDTLIPESDSKWVLNSNGERIGIEVRKDSLVGQVFLTDAMHSSHYELTTDTNYIKLKDGMFNVSYLGSNFYFGLDSNGNLMTGFVETVANTVHLGANVNLSPVNASGKEKYYLYAENGAYKGIKWTTPIALMNIYYVFDAYGRVISETPITGRVGTNIIMSGQDGIWQYDPIYNFWTYYIVDVNGNKQQYKNGTYPINYLGTMSYYTFDEYGKLISETKI